MTSEKRSSWHTMAQSQVYLAQTRLLLRLPTVFSTSKLCPHVLQLFSLTLCLVSYSCNVPGPCLLCRCPRHYAASRCFSFAPTLWPSVHALALLRCWSLWSLASALSLLLLPHLFVSCCTASHLYMRRCLFVSFSHPKRTNTNISLYGWPVPWLKITSAGHYQLRRLLGSLQTSWLRQYSLPTYNEQLTGHSTATGEPTDCLRNCANGFHLALGFLISTHGATSDLPDCSYSNSNSCSLQQINSF